MGANGEVRPWPAAVISTGQATQVAAWSRLPRFGRESDAQQAPGKASHINDVLQPSTQRRLPGQVDNKSLSGACPTLSQSSVL